MVVSRSLRSCQRDESRNVNDKGDGPYEKGIPRHTEEREKEIEKHVCSGGTPEEDNSTWGCGTQKKEEKGRIKRGIVKSGKLYKMFIDT